MRGHEPARRLRLRVGVAHTGWLPVDDPWWDLRDQRRREQPPGGVDPFGVDGDLGVVGVQQRQARPPQDDGLLRAAGGLWSAQWCLIGAARRGWAAAAASLCEIAEQATQAVVDVS